MLLFILVVIMVVILWKTGNAKMRKMIACTAMGLTFVAIVHTALQYNTSQNSSVKVKSEGVIERDINDYKHENQQYAP